MTADIHDIWGLIGHSRGPTALVGLKGYATGFEAPAAFFHLGPRLRQRRSRNLRVVGKSAGLSVRGTCSRPFGVTKASLGMMGAHRAAAHDARCSRRTSARIQLGAAATAEAQAPDRSAELTSCGTRPTGSQSGRIMRAPAQRAVRRHTLCPINTAPADLQNVLAGVCMAHAGSDTRLPTYPKQAWA